MPMKTKKNYVWIRFIITFFAGILFFAFITNAGTITIPTNITNTLQVIKRILITDDWTQTGIPILDINTGNQIVSYAPVLLAWSGMVWNDIQNTYLFDSSVSANIPSRTAIGGWNIDTRCFGGGSSMNEMFGNVEIPHDIYTGTWWVLWPHIHWMSSTTSATTTWVRRLDYTILTNNQMYSSTKTMTITIRGMTWWQQRISEFDPDIPTTGLNLWDMISFRIYRDPTTTADTYNGSMCIQGLWFHYMKDWFGSRQEFTK